MKEIVMNLEKRPETNDTKFERALVSQIYDKDFSLTEKLYYKLNETNKVDEMILNMFAFSAA